MHKLFAFLCLLLPLSACGNGLPDTPDENALILDVRTLQEWQISRLADAQLLPYDEISEGIAQFSSDLEQPIYLYCRSGNRASHALRDLQRLGYTQVYNLGSVRDASTYLGKDVLR